MFTGIITSIGEVVAADGGHMTIACDYDPESIALGASIACDGCCLTVTDVAASQQNGCRFMVDISNETRDRTTLGGWKPGRKINLERALTLQDELGGHMVSGHVDAVAMIKDRQEDGDSFRFMIDLPAELAHLVAGKGSVALDGVSLTVNDVEDACFSVNLVPHTLSATTWGAKKTGDAVNLEVDLLARYVARISMIANRT
ncbi:MAG: riboflavin synthase [Hyphomicrobiales bacterium]|nr:riboflavin synthase [Hyphomicrobiales bacterium]